MWRAIYWRTIDLCQLELIQISTIILNGHIHLIMVSLLIVSAMFFIYRFRSCITYLILLAWLDSYVSYWDPITAVFRVGTILGKECLIGYNTSDNWEAILTCRRPHLLIQFCYLLDTCCVTWDSCQLSDTFTFAVCGVGDYHREGRSNAIQGLR